MKCPHCQSEIDFKASKCPYCTGNIGHGDASLRSFGGFVGVTLATGIIVFVLALFFSDAGFFDNLATGVMSMIFGPVVWVFAAFLTPSKR